MPIRVDDLRSKLLVHPDWATDAERTATAAVAAIIRERNPELGPEILLIRRAEDPRDTWSGHMAFPGGRRDQDDASLLATAVRETLEEVGLDLSTDADLLGRLIPMPAMRRTTFLIAPFVFDLRNDATLSPNREVAETIWAPIAPMIRGDLDATYGYMRDGIELPMPAFRVKERVVWGLTYQMLRTLFRVAGARE